MSEKATSILILILTAALIYVFWQIGIDWICSFND